VFIQGLKVGSGFLRMRVTSIPHPSSIIPKHDPKQTSCYHGRMPSDKKTPRSKRTNGDCAICVKAGIVSLNGGIVLAICLLLTAVTAASVLTKNFVASQTILFVILSLASWMYLLDGASEKLYLAGGSLIRSSLFGRSQDIDLSDVSSFLLKHEGLNQKVGIESLTVAYGDGREERLPLGPCWRRRDLEHFLESVERVMGYENSVVKQG
jgi:hypothetical protein